MNNVLKRRRTKLATRSFLLRRRADSWLLMAGAVSMPLRVGLAGIATFFFSCIGAYLVAVGHRSARLFPTRFPLFAVLYAVWSCGLIFWRGEHPLDDRQLGYSLLFALFAFAGPGMVLIARPLRMFVIGSRIGVTLALVMALALSALQLGRIGIGGNAAVFAFVVAVASLGATMFIEKPLRWLPNGPYYLLIGTATALLSETRAVMVVLPIFAVVEFVAVIQRYRPRIRVLAYMVALATLIGVGMVPKVQDVIADRWISMTYYYVGMSDTWSGRSSADIRLAMWKGAISVIAEHPITGVGSGAKMDAVNAKLNVQEKISARFRHVHNSFLDELLNNGVVGLLLMLATIISAITFAWSRSLTADERRNLTYFVGLVLATGMLHNPLLHETMLGAIFLYLGVFHASVGRRRLTHRPHQHNHGQS